MITVCEEDSFARARVLPSGVSARRGGLLLAAAAKTTWCITVSVIVVAAWLPAALSGLYVRTRVCGPELLLSGRAHSSCTGGAMVEQFSNLGLHGELDFDARRVLRVHQGAVRGMLPGGWLPAEAG